MATTPFSLLGIALFVSAIALPVRLGASGEPTHDVEHDHASHTGRPQSSTLVERVREATAGFRLAIPPEYEQFLGGVSGPEEGAMGVYFVNAAFVDGEVDVARPEALIYELKNGRARLGVEYIVPADAWDPSHTEPPAPPALEGQVFQLEPSPVLDGV